MAPWLQDLIRKAAARWTLPPGDLLRDRTYRRLWSSIVISSFGGQVTMLALPLTAAVLLHATPTQMGLLGAVEILPFVLLSLPAGVWLDRVRKLPVYIAGGVSLLLAAAAGQLGIIRRVRELPVAERVDGAIVRGEADVGSRVVVT